MTNRYIGCEDATSAIAKLEVVKCGKTKTTYYFGDNMDAIAKYYSFEGYSDTAVTLYFRDNDTNSWVKIELCE